jgi:hypothetical protein
MGGARPRTPGAPARPEVQRSTLSELARRHLRALALGLDVDPLGDLRALAQSLDRELAALERERAALTVTSPAAGTALATGLAERTGDYIDPGDALLAISDPDQLVAEIALPGDQPLEDLGPGSRITLHGAGAATPPATALVASRRARPTTAGTEIVVVTQPFAAPWVVGGAGHAVIEGRERSLGYAWLTRPLDVFGLKVWALR